MVLGGWCARRSPDRSLPPMAAPEELSSGDDTFASAVLTDEFWENRKQNKPTKVSSAASLHCDVGVDDFVAAMLKGSRPQFGSTMAFKQGEPYPRDSIYMAYLDNATLVLNDAEHYLPAVLALCKGLETAFGFVSARLVIDPPDYRGPALQADGDLLMVQLMGEQSFTVTRPLQGLPVSAPRPKPALEPVLTPGDVLYVPVGFECRLAGPSSKSPVAYILLTLQSAEQSLDLSLSKYLTDLLQDKSQFDTNTDALFRSAVTRHSRAKSQDLEPSVKKSVQELLSKVKAADLRQHFNARMEKLRASQLTSAGEVRAAPPGPKAVTSRSTLRMASGVGCKCVPGSSTALFSRGSETMKLNIAPTASALLDRLSDGMDHVVNSLPCDDPIERICVCHVMLLKGCLDFAPGQHDSRSGYTDS
eukprot:TRINITY_DN49455_c0_g1_i1.p1 TRINITY_DN49455_c0_g1~~TRINITY_DN49455_c0_g1_i1.p1  ORF type:complete len:428 (-),score=78.01 TRINITY_DN49455_c0_g1_i1:75-1328(-)